MSAKLHTQCMRIARKVAKECVEEYDGEMCFSLPAFLDTLERRLSELFCGDSVTGKFNLDDSRCDIARYLFCCLAMEQGDAPDGNTFSGVPVLD